MTREWQIKTTRYLTPLQSIHFPFSPLSTTPQSPADPLQVLKQPFKKTTSDLKVIQGYWARFESSLGPVFSISSHREWDISATNALPGISSQGKSECHVKVISKLLWDHPRSFSACTHTHTHTLPPSPPRSQMSLDGKDTPNVLKPGSLLIRHLRMSFPNRCYAIWLGFFRQWPTSTHGLWDRTHSLPSQPLQGSPKCVPLKTPLSSSPPATSHAGWNRLQSSPRSWSHLSFSKQSRPTNSGGTQDFRSG